jgi:UDP-glucose 4-epimerase
LYLLGRRPAQGGQRFCEFDLSSVNMLKVIEPLQQVETLIHCAARVHITDDSTSNPLSEFRVINTEVTLNFARQAVQAGVKRFIFLSSIK